MSPEERAEYWSAQSDEQKRHLCDTYPELIGNADGVEAWARDRANRLNLDAKEARAREDLARYESYWTKARTNEDRYLIGEKIQRAKSDLAAYEKIRSTLANGISLEEYQRGKQGDPVSLLTLQDDGRRVKAAAAQGNMPVSDVATVAWLGYDAPGEASFGNLSDITSPKLAQAGSDRLAGFLNGMQASREHGAGDAHMTLVGHSYGSTTSGMAATKVHDGVIDDLVLCGSPGMGTYNASDLHVAEGHRWVSGVPNGDFVQGLGSLLPGSTIRWGHLGTDPMHDKTFTHLSNDATGYVKYNHGAPPSDSHLLLPMLRLGLVYPPNFDNHSVYLEDGTETVQDFGRVVAGVK